MGGRVTTDPVVLVVGTKGGTAGRGGNDCMAAGSVLSSCVGVPSCAWDDDVISGAVGEY